MEEEKKVYQAYMKPPFDAGVIFGPMLMVLGFFALFTPGAIVGVFMLIGGGWLLYSYFTNKKRAAARMRELEASGELAALLSDFRAAEPIADGNIRLGEQYLYPKRGGERIAYGDLLQVYQTVHKTNFVEDRRTITAVVRDGDRTKTVSLCALALRGKGDDVLRDVMLRLLVKNPNIKLGYK